MPPTFCFDPSVLAVDLERRQRILPVLEAALHAVDPGPAVARAMQRTDSRLVIGAATYDLEQFERVFLLGFGKAAVAMGRAAAAVLGGRVAAGALLTKHGHAAGAEALPAGVDVSQAGHPVPDEAGVVAAQRIAALAQQATSRDLVLCLISGGGSALLTLPAVGLTLSDLQATTAALLRCGASIDEINTVRKHLEQLKGGQLARLANPAAVASLVLSDVVGSPLDVIASGPTEPDRSTWADAWEIAQRYRLEPALPVAVVQRLRSGRDGHLPDTPKAGDPAFERCQTVVVADNAVAAQAAARKADELGFTAQVLSTFVEGEAREVAKVAVALGREVAARGQPVAPPACLLLGGETTVTLRGDGRGGRNQELALAAALALARVPEGERIVIASLATDGSDGPTDSAGGLADAHTVARGRAAGLDAAAHLAGNNAYPFLEASGDLLRTGPTQTNVNDLIAIFVF
jgi:hydroxypyruvate reductase